MISASNAVLGRMWCMSCSKQYHYISHEFYAIIAARTCHNRAAHNSCRTLGRSEKLMLTSVG